MKFYQSHESDEKFCQDKRPQNQKYWNSDAQQFVSQILRNLELSGIDYWVLIIIQLLFAIATLMPILIHICVSSTRRIIQAWKTIREEIGSYPAPLNDQGPQ